MKKIVAIVLMFTLFYACKPGIPENIIQPDKMEKVLFDIHAVDGYLGTFPSADSAKRIAASYYFGIYKKYAIDSATYTRSLNYYYNNPVLLNKIYGTINKQIEQARKENDKLVNQRALERQRLDLAKARKVLVVPDSTAKAAPFTFSEFPFVLVPQPVY